MVHQCLPRRVSDWHEATIVMFLDEFQNTRLPQYNFDVVGLMQEAVESPTCPHFVTGSAMSILAKEILGRGSLFGRFRSRPIESMTKYWGAELALKAARHYNADISRNHGSGSGGAMRRKPVLYHGCHSAIGRAEQTPYR